MSADFASIYNHNEAAVFAEVQEVAPGFPAVAEDGDLLADVACVALNRLQPRYIRHAVDFSFFQTDNERADHATQVAKAVEFAFGFVQARAAMRARR
jgi:hypothetical protein